MNNLWATLRNGLRFIRFSHTVFALPFALVAMVVAARGLPSARVVLLILICMVAARTAAMAFNRWADWELDKANPRTADRHTLMSRRGAWFVTLAAGGVFIAAAAGLNLLCLALAPAALVLVLGYSYAKRFTAFAHAILGLALAAAPMGAWAAVCGTLWAPAPWVLAAGVLAWVWGFDLIYATLDEAFDRKAGLHSFPARHGTRAALRLAGWLHTAAWLVFGLFGWVAHLGWPYGAAWGATALALAHEHRLARTGDVRQVNAAFFRANAVVGMLLLAGTAVAAWLKTHTNGG